MRLGPASGLPRTVGGLVQEIVGHPDEVVG